MLSINTNLSSLIAQNSMKTSTSKLNQAIERMTTGFRINGAKDNAANYSISTNMTTRINSYMVAEDNTLSALDLVSTAEGILDQIDDKLQRVRALQEQTANGTYGAESLKAINAEVNALIDEVERLYSTAEYNGIKLFAATDSSGGTGSAGGDFKAEVVVRNTDSFKPMSEVDVMQTLAADIYSISDANDLVKLATLANNGRLAAGSEFVLANDIDMSGVTDWVAIGMQDDGTGNILPISLDFDGNGHVIKNLTINETVDIADITSSYFALFGVLENSSIQNLGVENININLDAPTESITITSTLLLMGQNTTLSNCYTTGSIVLSENIASYGTAALAAVIQVGSIENCYSSVDITAEHSQGGYIGGLTYGLIQADAMNCEYSGNIYTPNQTADSGYLLGGIAVSAEQATITNCVVSGELPDLINSNSAGIFIGNGADVELINCQYNSSNTLGLVGDDSIDGVTMTNVTPIAAPAVVNYSLRSATSNIGFINAITQRNTTSMTKLSSVSTETAISNGTYSISTVTELKQLATMTNAGKITGGEFVLANDIDLGSCSDWISIGVTNPFTAIFDGNGYVISNLTTSNNATCNGSLFEVVQGATIKNLGVENLILSHDGTVLSGSAAVAGGIASGASNTLIENCYVTGSIDGSTAGVGGIVGAAVGGYVDIQSCWADVDVIGSSAGGLVGTTIFAAANVNNSYAKGDVDGSEHAGGLIGYQQQFTEDPTLFGKTIRVTNSGFLGSVSGASSVATLLNCNSDIGTNAVTNCYYDATLSPGVPGLTFGGVNDLPASAVVGKSTAQAQAMLPTLHDYPSGLDVSGGSVIPSVPSINYVPAGAIVFQVGISGDRASQLSIDISFGINNISKLRNIGLDNNNYFTPIDSLLSEISAKQTEYGAISNRLESVLEEINIQYENLVSSRSTIRDADIAEVSSHYIQQQILQQAAATLMSTANQSPAIALQLI